ncbi:MAG TPA: LCP family protein [Clostridiaceae bacterium]|nr:LCP family protein [Clostridiaceae bacterium]
MKLAGKRSNSIYKGNNNTYKKNNNIFKRNNNRFFMIIAIAGILLILFTWKVLIPGYQAVVAGKNNGYGQVTEDNGNKSGVTEDEEISKQLPIDENIEEKVKEISDDLTLGVTVEKPYPEKLVEDDGINILIMGEDKENYLYDTLGIISISREAKKVKLIMIPRDLYIKYNPKIIELLREANLADVPGVLKINYAHHIGVMLKYEGDFKTYSASFLAQIIKEKFGIKINDYVKTNLQGFRDIVDVYGGVEINVPYDMNYDDPLQDLSIHLKKGPQRLNGEQAEGFVRFRQGYTEEGEYFEIGDVGRKENQIAFIKAFASQAGTLSNIDKIPEVIKILGKNVQHSIGVGDVLTKYMSLAKDIIINKYDIEGLTLEGKMQNINGVFYIVIDDGE